MKNALGIADYQGPVAPVMRIVEIPSMNKDGIAWGAITGIMAVEAAKVGRTGEFYNLLEIENQHLIESLGKDYEIMNLYFKYFPCCRWAHAPIVAALDLKKKYQFEVNEIEKIKIYTFKAATELSLITLRFCDEAQYNIVYPICAALTEGKFTPVQDSEAYIRQHKEILSLMKKVEYMAKTEFEKEFPQKRYAQVEITFRSGKNIISDVVQPWEERAEKVDLEWVWSKMRQTLDHCITEERQKELLERLKGDSDIYMKKLVTEINKWLILEV